MPIDYKKYPANWKTEIVPAIKDRDGHRCNFCGVENYSIIDCETRTAYHLRGTSYAASVKLGVDLYSWEGFDKSPREMFKIVVLTCMHLDHDITNNGHSNLAMGCQRCHLRYDAEHHAKNSKATRKAKLKAQTGQIEMF